MDGFVSETGEQIRTDCDLCHLISSQGTPGVMETAPIGQSLDFRHPADIDEAWQETL